MIKNQISSKLVRAIIKGAISLLAYDLIYRLKHPLKPSYTQEVDLKRLDIPLNPQLKWVEEKDYEQQMNDIASPFTQQYEHVGHIQVNEVALSYSFYLKSQKYPTIFIVHGFNEYKEKYQELIYYFLQLDYNVLVYDARGHGGSRVDPNQTLVDIDDFDVYIEDLKEVIEFVLKTYLIDNQLFLFGHSMGGAVSTMFLNKYPKIFKAAILSSPMLSVDTHPYPRSMTYAMANSAKFLKFGQKPIPSQGSNNVVEASTQSTKYTPNPNLTTSQHRENYYFKVRRDVVTNPTSGGTMNWLKASMTELNKTTQKSVLESIETPVLIFRSAKDIIVRADGIYTGATYLPHVDLVSISMAGHEIYQERDEILKPYISLISYYLEQFN